MKTLITKNSSAIVALTIAICAVYAFSISFVFAQTSPVAIDVVSEYTGKKVIESPSASPFTNSTCPSGSIMTGFNLDNVGDSYSTTGRLYCRSTNITGLGTVANYSNKLLIESSSASPFTNSTCPSGSIMTGFNLNDMGSNYGSTGSLYCQEVPSSIILDTVIEYQNKTLAESPPTNPFANSTCPDGSVLVGFNLYNMGDSYNNYGSLYCRSVRTPMNYSLSATNIGSTHRGSNGVSTVSATLMPGGTIKLLFNGSCVTTYDYEFTPRRFDNVTCRSNNPAHPMSTSYNSQTTSSFKTNYYNNVCGTSNWTSDGTVFTCSSAVSSPLPSTTEAINLAISQMLNSDGVNVLGNIDGTGINFLNFNPSTATPTASSALTLQVDSATPYGLYTGTVVSNVANSDVSLRRSATFTLSVYDAPKPAAVTTTPGVCGTNPTEVAISWSAPNMATGYTLVGYKVYLDNSHVYTTPGPNVTTYTHSTTPGSHTYGVSAVYLYETSPGVFIGGVESSPTVSSVTVPTCQSFSCSSISGISGASFCPGEDQNLTSNWISTQVSSCNSSVANNETKCEYNVTGGNGGACVGNPIQNTYSCQDTNPSVDTTRLLVEQCTETRYCEYVCSIGYIYNSGVCVADTTSISCAPYRTNEGTPILPNQRIRTNTNVTWKLSPNAPSTDVSYSWSLSGTDQGVFLPNNKDISVTYTIPGTKTASVTITPLAGQSQTISCNPGSINVTSSSIEEI